MDAASCLELSAGNDGDGLGGRAGGGSDGLDGLNHLHALDDDTEDSVLRDDGCGEWVSVSIAAY